VDKSATGSVNSFDTTVWPQMSRLKSGESASSTMAKTITPVVMMAA
jgi:hypothetical protein